MKKAIYPALLLFIGLFFIQSTSCNYDNEEDLFDTTDCGEISNISLQNDIVPILNNACLSCHGIGVETAGINLESYESLAIYAENGKLLGSVKHETGFAEMPPAGGMLPECDIAKIEQWIVEGALNN